MKHDDISVLKCYFDIYNHKRATASDRCQSKSPKTNYKFY